MAPARRARRQHDIVSDPQPSVESAAESAVDSAPPLSDSNSPHNDSDSGSTGYGPSEAIYLVEKAQTHDPEARDLDGRMPWTPEPELYEPDTYTAWGRKYFGDDWYEQRKTMLQERNIYVYRDPVYKERQGALRRMERERQKGKLPPKGKTWQELMAWARMHYGESWYQHREAIAQLEREIDNTSDPKKQSRLMSKSRKRGNIMTDIQFDTDERMLAEGKTWHDILAFPAEPSNFSPSVETVIRSPSPSSDGDTNLSGYDTYPSTPTEFRDQARRGPEAPLVSGDVKAWRPHESEWDYLEWRGVHKSTQGFTTAPEEEYENSKDSLRSKIRSWHEDEEGDRRRENEWEEIQKFGRQICFDDLEEPWKQLQEYERRKERYNLLRGGLTQEQIDAKDREDAAYAKRRYEETRALPPLPEVPSIPMTREETDAKRRAWDASKLSKEEQAELIRKFRIHVRPSSTDRHTESAVVAQSQISPPRPARDTSRKTRSGRITKNAPAARQSTPTHAKAPLLDRRSSLSEPDVLERSSNTLEPRRRRRQRKTYQKERASRRLAGESPEYGMLLGRGETQPLYKASLRQPSNIRQTSSLGPCSDRLSKKPTAVRSVKPQGILRSRQAGMDRPKRLVKGSKG